MKNKTISELRSIYTIIALCLILFGSVLFNVSQFIDNKANDKLIETYDIFTFEKYNFSVKHAQGVNGLFVGDYFMVWAKDRTYSDIMRTCNHEYLHYQYKDDWEHFEHE